MTTPNPGAPLWPTNFQGCTVNAQYLDIQGNAIAGTVTFTASPDAMLDVDKALIIVPKTYTATLGNNGQMSIILPATDDPDINPYNWTYAVSENFSGGRKYNIKAPQNSIIDLSMVSPVPSNNGAPILRGPKGEAGGIQQVNGHSGDLVTLSYSDVGADQTGAAAAVGAVSLQKSTNLSDVASPSVARSNLGLGNAAVANVGTAAGQVMSGNQGLFSTEFNGPLATISMKDTGWLTSTANFTPVNGSTITQCQIRVVGGHMISIYLLYTLNTATSSAPTAGNYVNLPIARIASAYTPTATQGLGSGADGPAVSYVIDASGQIYLCAGPAPSLPSGSVLSVTGTYLI